MTVLAFPLRCHRCEREYLAPVSAEKLIDLRDAGVSATEVAAAVGRAQISQELVCKACRDGRDN